MDVSGGVDDCDCIESGEGVVEDEWGGEMVNEYKRYCNRGSIIEAL